jgi:acyl-CoA synthetase (AMP-forming)/AMP-acid ligase II
VPLSQRNLLASARSIARTLALEPNDRCLNIMPLFHIHGLIGATLSSLSAQASVHCVPSFDPERFFDWFRSVDPTWYSAVPTMHQAILERASAHPDLTAGHRLRFIRSSSAALPESLMAGLEARFGVPVIEAYGMTEASHQMASNPLPPRARKPRSVGVAAGPEIAIFDESGRPVAAGQIGEIVIRGASVTRGYENNAVANESAFSDGFFRTGDQGFLDAEGYLFLTGRIKEIINRAGEKVSPREVDDVLGAHPDVSQAVTFAVAHSTLGEDVAAAVVLRSNARATERELRNFARERLADFKVPQQVIIVDAIPMGATGKLQRTHLGKLLETRLRTDFVAPRTSLEEAIAGVWAEVLKVERVGVTENFFALGGDSLTASLIVNKARHLGVAADVFFQHPTVAEIAAAHLEREQPLPAAVIAEERPRGFISRLFSSK